MLIFLLLSTFQAINCYDLSSSSLLVKDQCRKLCLAQNLPALEPDKFEYFVCQSGCHFLNTLRYSGGLDVTPAVKDCHLSCKESFGVPAERSVCSMGCEVLASKTQNYIQKILRMTPQERAINDFVLGEPDSDLLETEFLSDPSIRSQLEVGFNVDYKIPETHIRTMPIEDKDQPAIVVQTKSKDGGDWLDCASKNSGIPRWILLCTMLGAIMVAIWLTLSMESRKGPEESDDEMLVEIPDEKLMENYVIEKDGALLENAAFCIASEDDVVNVKFSPPPKYEEVNEMDNSELPNYAEAVKSQTKEDDA